MCGEAQRKARAGCDKLIFWYTCIEDLSVFECRFALYVGMVATDMSCINRS